MLKFFVIRHGETKPNIRGECLGRNDVPLNDKGVFQASILSDKLKEVDFDFVYSSPLKRAVQTAEICLKKSKVHSSLKLVERDWGDWEGMTLSEIENQYPSEFQCFREDMLNYSVPNGEASIEVQMRVNDFLSKILNEYDNKIIVIVTHLGTARHIISKLLGLKSSDSWRFWIDNAAYAEIDYDKKSDKGLLKKLNC